MDSYDHDLPAPRIQLDVNKNSSNAKLLKYYTLKVLHTEEEISFVVKCKHAQLCQNRKSLHTISVALVHRFRIIYATVTIRTFL